ncbi:atp-dependent rna helicase dbp9 [Lasallia pustulata]|uniref:RNA helicase n=1 Tax=Lasallia pustulata TaxID=136370 RepID=A0A1W5D861_9LECA|nr:atp-dependent rna helicase dbp9 [Lasallia pustulata]
MKRKLNEDNVPTAKIHGSPTASSTAFNDLGLDARLLQALVKENFSKPTPVQSKAIPLALEGTDILARAKTGSGKTAAYVLPILEGILRKKGSNTNDKSTSALILVPTRELAEQVSKAFSTLSTYCAKDVRILNLTQKIPDAVQRSLLADLPDIVVTTPARASLNINTSALSLQNLAYLVIDEADLVLSYGYDEDLQNVAKVIPKGVQTFLMSATLTSEVETLKGLFCLNPVVLKLEETQDDGGGVSQYVVKCAEDEKFLLIYVIFKLKLVKGKCIIFVSDIDRCYRLKLFLEQFGTKSCVLNSELPVNSRIHVVEEFNKNVYEIIIASDEHEVLGCKEDRRVQKLGAKEKDMAQTNLSGSAYSQPDHPDITSSTPPDEEGTTADVPGEETAVEPRKKKRKSAKRDKEYGISRGIDFKNVACVLNFDLPTTSESYTHRIGRTARAGKNGMALSFIVPAELYRKHKPTSTPTAENDEGVLAKIIKQQSKKGKDVKPYHFDMKQVDAFRYRMGDALRAVTRLAIREARTRELRQELLKSEKLKRHFEENPGDLHHLRHDGELRAARVQPHLKHVPDYLMPSNGKRGVAGGDIGFVGIGKTSENRIRKARMHNRMKGRGRNAIGKKLDPLKTFNAKGRR